MHSTRGLEGSFASSPSDRSSNWESVMTVIASSRARCWGNSALSSRPSRPVHSLKISCARPFDVRSNNMIEAGSSHTVRSSLRGLDYEGERSATYDTQFTDDAAAPRPTSISSSPTNMRAGSLALSAVLAIIAHASATAQQVLVGYMPSAATRERFVEADAIRRPDPQRAAAESRELSKDVHVAGTIAQARTRDYVVAQMKAWGLETEFRTYDIWMPHATDVRVWRVAPDTVQLDLSEAAVPNDPTSSLPQYPTVNGYSGRGDVTGDIVYVNYGLIEDYALLDSMGVSVRGKIAVARYGQSFRGIKAREAERHGAVALIIYSDPQDDGFVRGDVYPDGPMRPPKGVQRGSVLNTDGDPSTPSYPSIKGAPRLAESKMDIPHIPVVPIGYGNAAELLRGLRGAAIPQKWQGG